MKAPLKISPTGQTIFDEDGLRVATYLGDKSSHQEKEAWAEFAKLSVELINAALTKGA